MLNLGCGQYLRNPFFPGFWGQKWGCGFCILADYTRLYTVLRPRCICLHVFVASFKRKNDITPSNAMHDIIFQ